MSRPRTRLIKSPLEGPQLYAALDCYNSYVPLANANELDLSKPIPSDREEWSPIVVTLLWELHPNRHIAFWVKPDLERLIVIRIKDVLTFQDNGLSPLRNQIYPENVRHAQIYSKMCFLTTREAMSQ